MKFRPATLIAVLALFVAIGGTATAASNRISGSKIKSGTVAGKAFKNQTITTTRISTDAIAALAGAKGPKGEKGEQGETGEQGTAGAPGTTTLSAASTKVAQAPNADVSQVVLNDLPASRYIATARVSVQSQSAGSLVTCSLESANGGNTDEAKWTSPSNGARGHLWMVVPTGVATNQLKVVCNAGNSSATLKTTLTAIPAL